MYKTWLKLRTPFSHEKYKKYKNKLGHIIKVAEKQYYASRFKDIEGDIKQTWKLIKSVINRNSTKSDDIHEIRINSNTSVSDPVEIANEFNEYFANIGKVLAKQIHKQMAATVIILKFGKTLAVFFTTS